MQASVTSKSYHARLLTQHVRLPLPSWSQLEASRTYASSFEKMRSKQMFRIPFFAGTQEKVMESDRHHQHVSDHVGLETPHFPATAHATPRATDGLTRQVSEFDGVGPRRMRSSSEEGFEHDLGPADLWGLERRGDHIYELDGAVRSDVQNLSHLRLIREALHYWQSYDGFARVSMSIGTNNLVTALAYYVLAYILVSNHAVIASWLTVSIFMAIVVALIRLDMSLTAFEFRTSVVFAISGPLVTAVAVQQWHQKTHTGAMVVRTVIPLVFLTHGLFLLVMLHICKVSEQRVGAMLPTGFRSVMYIDVFGWVKSPQDASHT